MENAVEGLKLAFAVMLLTLALSLTISFFSKARTTAELVLRSSDELAYYDYTKYDLPEDTSGNRIVSYETIIPTLYKYDKERYKVTFKTGTYDASTGEVTITGNLEVYRTKTSSENWNKNYVNDFDSNNPTSDRICSFDIVEEAQRNEPWVGDSEQVKLHLDAIFGGGTYTLPQNPDPTKALDYTKNPLICKPSNKNKKFVEQIGEIITNKDSSDDNKESVKGNNTTTKRIITYILIN